MKVSQAIWDGLLRQIETLTQEDENITDVIINYQVKPSVQRNYLKLTVKQGV